MFNYKILRLELLTLYLKYFIIITCILIGCFCISGAFEITQRFRSFDIPVSFFLRLILFKIPFLLSETAGIISLISMLFFLNRIIRYNELIIILCNGLSIWKVICIPIFGNIMFGLGFLCIINPISTYGLHKLTEIENKIMNKQEDKLFLLSSSFVFFEQAGKQNRIIKAESVNLDLKQLNKVIILFIDQDNNFIQRIDAAYANFANEQLKLVGVKLITKSDIVDYPYVVADTNLSIEHFTQLLTPPEKILIWDLSSVITKFLKAGLPTIDYKTYYYKQLFKPLLMITMTIFASCFINLNGRSASYDKTIIIALFIGLIAYFFIEVMIKVLVYSGMDPILAISLPLILIILMSNFVILHFHEA